MDDEVGGAAIGLVKHSEGQMTRDSFIAHDNATRLMPLAPLLPRPALDQTVDPFSAGPAGARPPQRPWD